MPAMVFPLHHRSCCFRNCGSGFSRDYGQLSSRLKPLPQTDCLPIRHRGHGPLPQKQTFRPFACRGVVYWLRRKTMVCPFV